MHQDSIKYCPKILVFLNSYCILIVLLGIIVTKYWKYLCQYKFQAHYHPLIAIIRQRLDEVFPATLHWLIVGMGCIREERRKVINVRGIHTQQNLYRVHHAYLMGRSVETVFDDVVALLRVR